MISLDLRESAYAIAPRNPANHMVFLYTFVILFSYR